MIATASRLMPRSIATLTRNRHLISQLVAREFAARYRGSVLGIFWAVVTPLVMVLVFTFIFGVVFQARWGPGEDGTGDFALNLLVGLMIHTIFAEAFIRAPTLILSQPSYVKKVVFPLEILPVVAVASALVTAAIGLCVVVVVNLFVNGVVAPTLVFLPLVIAPYALLVCGLVLFVSAVGVFVRDLGQIVSLISTVALFISPVFYPASAVPEGFRTYIYLNPLSFIVEQARAVVLYDRLPDFAGLALYAMAALAVAAAGLLWFQATRKGFADVV